MKALIIADLHSNIHALEAIWEAENHVDAVYCAGDVVDYGPFPVETIGWIRARGVSTVQGNHDRSIIRPYRTRADLHELPPEKTFWRHHNARLVGESEVRYLESLPDALEFEIDGIWYGMSHFFKNGEEIRSLYSFDRFRSEKMSKLSGGRVSRMIFGHTHRQGVYYLDEDICCINPGSTSYRRPDDPDQTAHYAVIEDGTIHLKRVEYDLDPVYQETIKHELFPHEREMSDWFFGPRSHEMRWTLA